MRRRFTPEQPIRSGLSLQDVVILIVIIAFLYLGIHLAIKSPFVIPGPQINLGPEFLPYYSFRSLARMIIAYLASFIFSLIYGYVTARSKTGQVVLLPLIDILQSIPILSFLPVVLLGSTAIFTEGVATEIAAIVLIFTSQAWNMTFSFYQSLVTIPSELKEAATIYRFNRWLRFKTVELPFSAIGLIWNSMLSWAGGWFFLMAAETFTLGERDYRLPGLGSYLQMAANEKNIQAIILGLASLIFIIVIIDQLIWRPLLAWSTKFKVESLEGEETTESWFYDIISRSILIRRFFARPLSNSLEKLDLLSFSLFQRKPETYPKAKHNILVTVILILIGIIAFSALIFGSIKATLILIEIPARSWGMLAVASASSWLRVLACLVITLLWTVPLGVAIGLKPGLAAILQPIIQILASIPATALFPIILLFLLGLPGGLDLAAIILMLLGTQWYLLFNVIAGSMAIPRDLIYTTTSLGLKGWHRWKNLILPALYPYLITGLIVANGGAWNATVVAEYVRFEGRDFFTTGLGSLISQATRAGDYPLLLVATLTMIFIVLITNRFVWRRLYRLAEERYHLD